MDKRIINGCLVLAKNQFKAIYKDTDKLKSISLFRIGTMPSVIKGELYDNPYIFCTINYEENKYKIYFGERCVLPNELIATNELLLNFVKLSREIKQSNNVLLN